MHPLGRIPHAPRMTMIVPLSPHLPFIASQRHAIIATEDVLPSPLSSKSELIPRCRPALDQLLYTRGP